jgi:2',3'-cyclic-nucleotide 2'-phosphodiesterase (5'-nucleotidase family)
MESSSALRLKHLFLIILQSSTMVRKAHLYSLLFLLSAGMMSCSNKPVYAHQQVPHQYTVDSTAHIDSNLVKMLTPYKRGVDTQMQVIIGHTDIPLTKAQPESTLGNFVADAQLMAAQVLDKKVDASISNYGGLRIPYIDPGPITRGKIYELMPFDNMLTIIEIPGTIVKQFCDFMALKKGWPLSGISFTIKNNAAENITIGGKELNPNLYYKFAISDYVARGGDNCDFLAPCKKRFTSIFIRDAMMAYIVRLEKEGKPLHPQIENRIQYAE